MGLFSRAKGEKVKLWGHTHKCDSCGHDRFENYRYVDGERYDYFKADCAKCGRSKKGDGPMHKR